MVHTLIMIAIVGELQVLENTQLSKSLVDIYLIFTSQNFTNKFIEITTKIQAADILISLPKRNTRSKYISCRQCNGRQCNAISNIMMVHYWSNI